MKARRGGNVAVAAGLALTLCSCASFNLVDDNYKPKGRKMAVISGLNDESNVYVAKLLGRALDKASRFKIMSQKKIAAAVADYPVNIKGPYDAAYFEVDVDYTKTDVKAIRAIQKKLGVDYMYVLWVPGATLNDGNVKQLHVVSQLFEFPGGKEVGNGKFDIVSQGGIFLHTAPTIQDDAEAAKKTAARVAQETAEKLGMLKTDP